MIMMYFHHDGCGACVIMEKTAFKYQPILDSLKSSFIVYEVNFTDSLGAYIKNIYEKLYNLYWAPTFLFMNHRGELIHKIVGIHSNEEFLEHLAKAKRNSQSYSFYNNQYQSGNRNPDFLYDYCFILNEAGEADSLRINEYLSTQKYEDLYKEKNLKFLYYFAYFNHKLYIPFESGAFRFYYENPEKFYHLHSKAQIEARIAFMLERVSENAIKANDKETFNKAIRMFEPYERKQPYFYADPGQENGFSGMLFPDNYILKRKIDFFMENEDYANYLDNIDEYVLLFKNDATELNDIAYEQQEKFPFKHSLIRAKALIEQALKIEENPYFIDTYAAILFKLGDNEKALELAEKAFKDAGEDDEELIAVLQKRIKTIKTAMNNR